MKILQIKSISTLWKYHVSFPLSWFIILIIYFNLKQFLIKNINQSKEWQDGSGDCDMSVGHGQEVRVHVGGEAVWKITFVFVVVIIIVVVVDVVAVAVVDKAFS